MKVCKKKPISLRRVLRLPAPSSVQTGCLVWPSLNNWNNVHARRWMEGGLDTVHLKKLRLSFLRDFWHCTSENSLRDVFLVLCSGLKLSEATDRFMYKIGAKSSSFQLNTMSFLKKQTKKTPKLDTHASLQLSVFKLAPILTEVELCIFFILPQLYEQPSSVMRLVAFQVQQCLFIGQEKLFVSGGSVVRELFFNWRSPCTHKAPMLDILCSPLALKLIRSSVFY